MLLHQVLAAHFGEGKPDQFAVVRQTKDLNGPYGIDLADQGSEGFCKFRDRYGKGFIPQLKLGLSVLAGDPARLAEPLL